MKNVRTTGCTVPIRNESLGWVVQAAQAAMAVRKMIPPDIKKKLDQFSIGHQIRDLLKHDASAAEKAWDGYKPIGAQMVGSDMDPVMFEEAFKGMWDSGNKEIFGPHKVFGGNREKFKSAMLDELAKAVIDGRIAGTVTAEGVYKSVVLPWMQAMGVKPAFAEPTQPRYLLMTALTDRMLHDIPSGRRDIAKWANKSEYLSLPPLSVRAAQMSGAPPAPAAATPPPGDGTVYAGGTPGFYDRPVPIPAPAPLPAGTLSVNDVTTAVRDIVAQIQASPAAANLSPQQISDAAAATAFKWLQTQGVPTSNADVQKVVATEAARPAWEKWIVPAGIATVGGLVLYFVFRPRRRIIVTRSAHR